MTFGARVVHVADLVNFGTIININKDNNTLSRPYIILWTDTGGEKDRSKPLKIISLGLGTFYLLNAYYL